MAPLTDPYRTLGLARDASLEDIKRAYRRLAKENHPDAAGPAALPRFLAIQAAYEQLVDGRGRSARAGAAGAGAGAGAGPAPRASAADPDRANATHRAYAGRSRRTRPGTTGSARSRTGRPAPGSSDAGATGAGEATGGATAGDRGATADDAGGATGGSAGPAGAASGTGAGSETAGGRRTRGKATLGSTSYDGAEAGPFEPDWGGASWYGTTSGTYWTINPKEYADPRKHGPEYQARARRAARAATGGVAADAGDVAASMGASAGDAAAGEAAAGDAATKARMADAPTADDPATNDPTTDDEARGAAGSGRVGPEPTYTRADDPIHTTSSWWGSTSGSTAADRRDPVGADRATPPPPSGGPSRPPVPVADDALPPDLGAAARQLGRALTDERSARGGWRLAQAAVGWLPIALGVGWAIGELTGCSRSSASCDGADPWLAPIAVLLTLIPLLLVPRLASLAAAGGIAVAIVAVPAAAILSATNDESPSTERSVILGIVLGIAWLVGVAIAIARRARSADTGGPVS